MNYNYKVVFIHPDLGIGGAERLIIDMALALKQQNMDVAILTNNFDPNHCFKELRDYSIPITVYGKWIPRNIFGFFHAMLAYIKMFYLCMVYSFFVKRSNIADIYIVDQIPAAIPLIKQLGKKVVYYCHHPDLLSSTQGGFLKKLYRYPINKFEAFSTGLADVILVNSYYTRQIFKETFQDIKHQVKILYPTVSPYMAALLENTTYSKCLELIPDIEFTKTKDNVIFLSINRFHPSKNVELAIDALHYLKHVLSKHEFKNIILLIVGGYDINCSSNIEYFQKLTLETCTLGLLGQVYFIKSPSDTTKANLIHNSDCVIYTPQNEHFGIVPLEAMMGCTPVIACNSGGPKETVQHNVTGYLCEPCPIEIAKCMKMIIDDQTKAKSMGMVGKDYFKQKFSFDKFETELMTLIRGLNIKKNV